MALGHGLLGCLLMYLVLVASFLPQGFAMRLTGGFEPSKGSIIKGFEKKLSLNHPQFKGPVMPPTGPSPGTHPEEPPLPPLLQSQISAEQIMETGKKLPRLSTKHPQFKGPVMPPSGPSPGTHPEEPPLPPLLPEPQYPPAQIEGVESKKQSKSYVKQPQFKGPVMPPSGPSPGTHPEEPPLPPLPPQAGV